MAKYAFPDWILKDWDGTIQYIKEFSLSKIYYIRYGRKFRYFIPQEGEIKDITRQCAAFGESRIFDKVKYWTTPITPDCLQYMINSKYSLSLEIKPLE